MTKSVLVPRRWFWAWIVASIAAAIAAVARLIWDIWEATNGW